MKIKPKIAMDVVLVPPRPVIDAAILCNKSLAGPDREEIRLGRKDYIPHISLAMGFVRRENMGNVQKIVAGVARSTKPLNLKVEGVSAGDMEPNSTSMLVISRTKEIQILHETLMKRLGPFLGDDADESAFLGPAKENAVKWVKDFKTQASFENYFPHITIGKGTPQSNVEPIPFTASRIALCHLGPHCTCRHVIHSCQFYGKI